jgi:MFS family permease
MTASKPASILLLVVAVLAAMSLWFTSAAVLPEMVRAGALPVGRQALLSSSVQAGFVVGALFFAITGVPDRFDPRRVFALSAFGAAIANALLVIVSPASPAAVAARFATGALLAGVYPVGMKIAVGWGVRDRGLLVALLVGALTFGNGVPFLIAAFGGANWQVTVLAVSVLALLGGGLALAAGLGPYHAKAPRFEPGAIRIAVTDARVRAAYLGYLGHMWELYAMWAWAGAAATVSYAVSMDAAAADTFGRLTAFAAIAVGAASCMLGGRFADRVGKAEVAIAALAASGMAGLLTAATFGGPPWLTFTLVVVWGAAVIPDSPQFSALVADFAPARYAGSLLSLQTALGFALTIATVQAAPIAAAAFGWPAVLATTALGPAFGIAAMWRLRRRGAQG